MFGHILGVVIPWSVALKIRPYNKWYMYLHTIGSMAIDPAIQLGICGMFQSGFGGFHKWPPPPQERWMVYFIEIPAQRYGWWLGIAPFMETSISAATICGNMWKPIHNHLEQSGKQKGYSKQMSGLSLTSGTLRCVVHAWGNWWWWS